MGDIGEIIQRICVILPTMLLALVVHEFAHAWMARRYGDGTAQWSGRYTLNPAAHVDPIGTILFPIISIVMNAGIFFAWAKPVPIDPSRFNNYRKGLFWVALAGPLSNIILGFCAAFIFVAYLRWVPATFPLFDALRYMLEYFIGINFALAIFNLIPLPPLDGSKMVESFLSYDAMRIYSSIQSYSFYIFLALWISGALRVIAFPIILLSNLALTLAAAVLGIPELLKAAG